MATIVVAEPIACLPEARRVMFACGHVAVLSDRWRVGQVRRCDACAQREHEIVDIVDKERAGRKMLALYLSCGHIQWCEPPIWCPNAESARPFVGTSAWCGLSH